MVSKVQQKLASFNTSIPRKIENSSFMKLIDKVATKIADIMDSLSITFKNPRKSSFLNAQKIKKEKKESNSYKGLKYKLF